MRIGLVVAGGAAVAAAVIADLGLATYVLGVTAAVVGVVLLVVRWSRRGTALKVVTATTLVAVIVASATVAVTGWPSRPDSWDIDRQAAPDLSSVAGRLGDLLYVDGMAYDAATGAVRWRAGGDDAELIAVTTEVVVVLENATGDEAHLTGRDPTTGKVLWSDPASSGTRGIVHDGDTLVTSQWRRGKQSEDDITFTVAYDLRTGTTRWRDPRRTAVMECALFDAAGRPGPALHQDVVLLGDSSEGRVADVQVARVGDGKLVGTSLSCILTVRVVGDVVLYVEEDGAVVGLSASTGNRLWRTTETPGDLSGRGDVIFVGEDYDSLSGEPRTRYQSIDVRTGRTEKVSPPEGWLVGYDESHRQRGPSVWMPVTRGESVGMWRLGSDQVVTVSDAVGRVSIAEADVSGWIALHGDTEDIVGGRHANSWGLSPDGDLYGPFPGDSPWIASGVIKVRDVVYPLD